MLKATRIWFVIGVFFINACQLFHKKKPEVNNNQQVEESNQTFSSEPNDASVPYKGSYTKSWDLVHTALKLEPHFATQTMDGVATVKLIPHFYETNALELDAKKFLIKELISISPENAVKSYDYKDSNKIKIKLNQIFKKTDSLTLKITYTSQPENVKVVGSAAISQDKGLYFINHNGEDVSKPTQLWTQGETESNSCWFPTLDAPNQKTTLDISITVVDSFTTLSNGYLESKSAIVNGKRTDRWIQNKPAAPYLTMIAVGNWAEVKDTWRNMPVNYYVEKKYQPFAKLIFGNTPEMLTFFSEYTGVAYPWDKFHQVVVRDFVSGAMENTSAVVHMEGLQHDARSHLDYTLEDVVSHELFHHWFGDLVTCESWANLPLNESFATYGEYLWNEHKYGRDEADYMLQDKRNSYLSEAEYSPKSLFRPHYINREEMFDAHSYQKGGCVLHVLRNTIGDDAFRTGLKIYLDRYRFKTAEIGNLRMSFEEACGLDLSEFFNEWFMRKGHPKLEVTQQYLEGNYIVTVDQIGDLYHLPLELAVSTPAGMLKKKILLDSAHKQFTFSMGATGTSFEIKPAQKILPGTINFIKPSMVIFDSENAFLGELKINKPTDEWETQLKTAVSAFHRIQAFDYLKENKLLTISILKIALNDKFWALKTRALLYISGSEDFTIGEMAELKSDVEALVSYKNKAAVRQSALSAYDILETSEKSAILNIAFKDSSYDVLETALDIEDATNSWFKFKKELAALDNEQILSALIGKTLNDASGQEIEHMNSLLTLSPLSKNAKLVSIVSTLFTKVQYTVKLNVLRYVQKSFGPISEIKKNKDAMQIIEIFRSYNSQLIKELQKRLESKKIKPEEKEYFSNYIEIAKKVSEELNNFN